MTTLPEKRDAVKKEFHDFEHRFWNVTAERYDSGCGQVTEQSVKKVLENLGLDDGDKLLDIACGPGYVTREAMAKKIEVTGIDFSDAMITLAKANNPGSEFKVADAENLPFADETFDGACCNFGVLHFPNPEKAISEAFRVCKPGARYSFTVWNNVELSPAMSFIMNAIKKYASTNANLPEGPPFFQYADEEKSFAVLTKAGFKNILRQEITLTWPMESAENFVRHFYDGGARIGGILRTLSEQSIRNIIDEIDAKISPYKSTQGYTVPVSIVITSGEK